MHAWFTSDAHCLSSQFQVYIPHTHSIQTTNDIRMHAWFTSDVLSWISIFQVNMPIYAGRIMLIVRTSGCIRDAQVMHSVRVHYPKCIYNIHAMLKLPLTSGCIRGSQVIHALRVHYPRWIFPHTHHVYTTRYRHHDACMVHKWCTLFEFTFQSLHSTYAQY